MCIATPRSYFDLHARAFYAIRDATDRTPFSPLVLVRVSPSMRHATTICYTHLLFFLMVILVVTAAVAERLVVELAPGRPLGPRGQHQHSEDLRNTVHCYCYNITRDRGHGANDKFVSYGSRTKRTVLLF